MNGPGTDTQVPASPHEADMVPIVAAGTAVWLVILVVFLAVHHTLSSHHDGWWVSVAGTGVGLGVLGLAVSVRFRRRTGSSGSSGSSGE
jgi:hypothetical protein